MPPPESTLVRPRTWRNGADQAGAKLRLPRPRCECSRGRGESLGISREIIAWEAARLLPFRAVFSSSAMVCQRQQPSPVAIATDSPEDLSLPLPAWTRAAECHPRPR